MAGGSLLSGTTDTIFLLQLGFIENTDHWNLAIWTKMQNYPAAVALSGALWEIQDILDTSS
jgi:hypothetical protein